LVDISKREKQTSIYFEGYVIDFQSRSTKNGKKIFEFTLGNGANAVSVVIMANDNENLNLGN
jgi:DNA polymerase III alpha subunit (gram-positive type)